MAAISKVSSKSETAKKNIYRHLLEAKSSAIVHKPGFEAPNQESHPLHDLLLSSVPYWMIVLLVGSHGLPS